MRLFMNILLAANSLIFLLAVYFLIIGSVEIGSFILLLISYICFLVFFGVTLRDLKNKFNQSHPDR